MDASLTPAAPTVADLAALPWRAFIDHALEHHNQQQAVLVQALAARVAQVPPSGEGGELIRLAEHLWLGHGSQPQGELQLRQWLDALPAELATHEATAPSLLRARWALAQLAPRPAGAAAAPAEPDQATRWRALQNVLLALAAQGRAGAAQGLLQAAQAQSQAVPDAQVQPLAATANNLAAHLRAQPVRDADAVALMLQAADLALAAWRRAGTWLNEERADYQCALCRAAAGQGEAAWAHAQRCLQRCVAQQADALELFFAHEACWHAFRARGQPAQAECEAMAAELARITDAGLRALCEPVLATVKAAEAAHAAAAAA